MGAAFCAPPPFLAFGPFDSRSGWAGSVVTGLLSRELFINYKQRVKVHYELMQRLKGNELKLDWCTGTSSFQHCIILGLMHR